MRGNPPSAYRTVEQYLKSPRQMKKLFQDFPEAIDMTGEIASRCNLELELGIPRFPKFDVPAGETSYSYLRKMAYSGISSKYGQLTSKVVDRLEQELKGTYSKSYGLRLRILSQTGTLFKINESGNGEIPAVNESQCKLFIPKRLTFSRSPDIMQDWQ